jgi:hypothetical protein
MICTPDGLFLPMPIAQTGHLEKEKCNTNLDCIFCPVIRLPPFPLRRHWTLCRMEQVTHHLAFALVLRKVLEPLPT